MTDFHINIFTRKSLIPVSYQAKLLNLSKQTIILNLKCSKKTNNNLLAAGENDSISTVFLAILKSITFYFQTHDSIKLD